MRTDAATILVLTAIFAAVAGAVLWAFERTQKPGIPHLRHWAYASLLQGLGFACVIGLRSALPAQLGIVAGNIILMLALILYGAVIAAYAGRPVAWPVWGAVLTVYGITHAVFLYLLPNLPLRIALFSLFAAGILLSSAARLRFSRRPASPGERFVAALFGLTGLGMLLRAAAQYPFSPLPDAALFANSGHAGVFHLMALISNIVISFGFAVLCIERSRTESDKALSEVASQREIFRRQFEMLPVSTNLWRISGKDFILESANFAAQVMSEGKIWSQVGMAASQVHAKNPEIIESLNQCRDGSSYFVREVSGIFGTRSDEGRFSLTFNRISPDLIAVYSEEKRAD